MEGKEAAVIPPEVSGLIWLKEIVNDTPTEKLTCKRKEKGENKKKTAHFKLISI